MNETGPIAPLFLTLRVAIIGGLLLILPRITRKGLLFGTYVGEAAEGRAASRRLLSRWYRGCVILMLVSLFVGWGIALAGAPVMGNFTGTAVLLLGALVLYVPFYKKARQLAPITAEEQARTAVAPLLGGESKGAGLARLALGICLIASVAAYVYALVGYSGEQSFFIAVSVPSLNLVLSPFLALIALLTATAKRSLRGGSGGGSLEAQDAFRATNTVMLSWSALLTCAYLTYISVEITRIGLWSVNPLAFGLPAVVVVLFMLFYLIRIIKVYGQGGALIESGNVDTPLTNGLADNAHWVGGLFYVDRDDPSILVEKRFGIGYTFNYGHRTAILIVVGVLMLTLALVTVGLIGQSG